MNESNEGKPIFTNIYFDLLFNDTANIHDYHGKILSHSEINQQLRNIRRFYSKVSDSDILILGADKIRITIEETIAIRKFIEGYNNKNSIDHSIEDAFLFETDELNQLLKESPSFEH